MRKYFISLIKKTIFILILLPKAPLKMEYIIPVLKKEIAQGKGFNDFNDKKFKVYKKCDFNISHSF